MRTRVGSLNHLVGAQQDSRWNRHAECFGSFEVDYHLERGRLLYRKIGRVFALENSSRVDGQLTICRTQARSLAHQAASHGEFATSKNRRDRVTRGQQHKLVAPNGKELVGLHNEPADVLIDDGRKRRVDLAVVAHVEYAHQLPDLVSGGLHARQLGAGLGGGPVRH
jgi:hypothetical protein